MTVAFIGIGVMGQPMALNLLRAGVTLTVWNRTPSRCAPLAELGAVVAASPSDAFAAADTVILMMIDEPSTDLVLGRRSPAFAQNVQGRLIVLMGTMSPQYSQQLELDIVAAGGRYVEAPVSGSRTPAESGELVAMVAGANSDAVEEAQRLIEPMCASVVACGAVPGALSMKLAVNLYMIGMVTALAEAANFASRLELDLDALAQVISAGPMDSALARTKIRKLRDGDFDVQAAITDVVKNADLIADAARDAQVSAPVINLCADLYHHTAESGWGRLDMVAVVKTYQQRPDNPPRRRSVRAST